MIDRIFLAMMRRETMTVDGASWRQCECRTAELHRAAICIRVRCTPCFQRVVRRDAARRYRSHRSSGRLFRRVRHRAVQRSMRARGYFSRGGTSEWKSRSFRRVSVLFVRKLNETLLFARGPVIYDLETAVREKIHYRMAVYSTVVIFIVVIDDSAESLSIRPTSP